VQVAASVGPAPEPILRRSLEDLMLLSVLKNSITRIGSILPSISKSSFAFRDGIAK
jgi:hypothetical protein